jgi:hypothetical protein
MRMCLMLSGFRSHDIYFLVLLLSDVKRHDTETCWGVEVKFHTVEISELSGGARPPRHGCLHPMKDPLVPI